MTIIAIDPGPVQSAIVVWDGQRIERAEIIGNDDMLVAIGFIKHHAEKSNELPDFYIEKFASYGMAIGMTCIETCFWIGEFKHAWRPATAKLITRQQIKLHHCKSPRAKDSNVSQALRDKYGDKGTKSNSGTTYGLKRDLWQAFALATYATENKGQNL